MTDAVAMAVAEMMMASDGQLSVCLFFQPTFFSSIAKLVLETFFSGGNSKITEQHCCAYCAHV